MDKKKLIIGLSVLVVVVFAILLYNKSTRDDVFEPYFPDEPEAWIEPYNEFGPSDYTVIDVDRMTKSKAVVDDRHQRYVVNGEITSFYFHGAYNGEFFYQSYTEQPYYEEMRVLYKSGELGFQTSRALEKQYTKIKISNKMDSDDGIIEGLIAARLENGKFVFYIFVDEDWKEQMPFTNIVWGDDWSNRNTMKQRVFDFSMVDNGVYVDKIEDSGWLDYDPIKGGIIVGKITINDVLNDNTNSTYIYTR